MVVVLVGLLCGNVCRTVCRTTLWECSVGVLRGRQRVDLPLDDDDTLITGVFRKRWIGYSGGNAKPDKRLAKQRTRRRTTTRVSE